MRSPVSLYLRIRSASGGWTYARSVSNSNERIRPLYALVDGKAIHCPEGVYHLRFNRNGKRVWEPVGVDSSAAFVTLQKRNLELQGEALGVQVREAPPVATPIPTSVVAPEDQSSSRPLPECIAGYLAETKEHKSEKTLAAYTETLDLFVQAVKRQHIEDITREDVMSFMAFLRKRGNAPRTIRNRVDFFQIFLHHFGLPSLLKGKDLPKYTEKKVRAYNDLELGKMFGRATQDESDLLYFLLCTGVREQEAQFVCWSDVDLEAKTYTVTEHLDLKYRPKDKEEGSVPIPDVLVEVLRERRQRYPKTRLIFPGRDGKPNGHALRLIKRLALRAGVNCGHCVNKPGKSCATHPVCKHVVLHKMRKTFATNLHRDGVSARTIMRLLRHSALDTTLRYLADQDDSQVREIANTTFQRFGGVA